MELKVAQYLTRAANELNLVLGVQYVVAELDGKVVVKEYSTTKDGKAVRRVLPTAPALLKRLVEIEERIGW